MSVYQKIFTATTRRAAHSAAFNPKALVTNPSKQAQALWVVPAGVGATWFIWNALTDDLRGSLGFAYDPNYDVNRVEMERMKRMDDRAALKAAKLKMQCGDDDDEADDDDDEEDGGGDDDCSDDNNDDGDEISAAVSAAVASAMDADDDDDDDDGDVSISIDNVVDDDIDDEEEEEVIKKTKKKKVEDMTLIEKYDYFTETSINPGEDDDEDDDDDDDDDDDNDDDEE